MDVKNGHQNKYKTIYKVQNSEGKRERERERERER